MKKLYHGSKDIIEKPTYGLGKIHNDYGLGFYCTENLDLAKEWSVDFDRDGYVNAYEIDDSSLKVLNLNDPNYNLLNWLAILLKNRDFDASLPLAKEAKQYLLDNYLINYEKYDVIIGYRADDSYFSFASDFLNGAISFRQLNRAMFLGDLGKQYVLKSKKAFKEIKFIKSELVNKDVWYPKKERRDRNARESYFNSDYKRLPNDLYIINILDEGIKQNDPRLR